MTLFALQNASYVNRHLPPALTPSSNGKAVGANLVQNGMFPIMPYHHAQVTVNLQDYLSGNPLRRAHFIQSLGRGLQRDGYVMLSHHGLTPTLKNYYKASGAFFNAPKNLLRSLNFLQRATVERGVRVSEKEEAAALANRISFHSSNSRVNVFPAKMPGFAKQNRAFYQQSHGVSNRLLEALIEFMGKHEGQPGALLNYMCQDMQGQKSNAQLTTLKYPALSVEELESRINTQDLQRINPHTDAFILNMIFASTSNGLRIQLPNGTWIKPFKNKEDTRVAVLSCDFLHNITRNLTDVFGNSLAFPSSRHSVLDVSLEDFLNPRLTASMGSLPHPDKPLLNLHSVEPLHVVDPERGLDFKAPTVDAFMYTRRPQTNPHALDPDRYQDTVHHAEEAIQQALSAEERKALVIY